MPLCDACYVPHHTRWRPLRLYLLAVQSVTLHQKITPAREALRPGERSFSPKKGNRFLCLSSLGPWNRPRLGHSGVRRRHGRHARPTRINDPAQAASAASSEVRIAHSNPYPACLEPHEMPAFSSRALRLHKVPKIFQPHSASPTSSCGSQGDLIHN